jgi:hypothetical protein
VLKLSWFVTSPSEIGRYQVDGFRPFLPMDGIYSPGVMRWAVVVPAFIIHTVPCLPLSGIPVD